jgi:hypothetical protein
MLSTRITRSIDAFSSSSGVVVGRTHRTHIAHTVGHTAQSWEQSQGQRFENKHKSERGARMAKMVDRQSDRLSTGLEPQNQKVAHKSARRVGRMVCERNKRTCTKTGPTAERSVRPEIAMHDARTDKLEEEIERILELVHDLGLADASIHRTREGRMHVSRQQESNVTTHLVIAVIPPHIHKKEIIAIQISRNRETIE